MDRQTVRQRTRSSGRHRSGTANPHQTRSGHSAAPSQARSHSQARSQSRHSHVPKSASPQKRSPYPLILFVFGLWTVSLAMAALAARSLLDPTVSSPDLVSPSAVSSAPAAAPARPAVKAPEAVLPSISPSSVSEPSRNDPPSPLADGAIAFDQTALPGAALDDRDFYQPSGTNLLPILALGTLTVSVAISWVLVLRILRPRRSPPMLQRSSGKPSTAKSAALKQLPAALSQPVIDPPKAAVQENSEAPPKATKDAVETAMPAIVTVLSSEQGLPLDWEEPSLADSLDLRHRQSFSS